MTPTFVVYIDESGDEGFFFDRGSSEWFVLSGVITRKAKDFHTVKLVDQVRSALGRPDKKALHFRKLKHEQRLLFVDRISKADLRTVSVLVHKPSLREPEIFRDRYRLYRYVVRYLCERVSWYGRDHRTTHDAGDGSAEIVFSNRSGMSYDEIRQYLELLQAQSGTGFFDVRIEWSVINPSQIKSYTPSRRMGLQVADAVAGSFYYAVQPSKYQYTEDRYARMLKPVAYRYRGEYLGYGLKFWPAEVIDMIRREDRFEWVRTAYKKDAGSGPQDPTR